jgi:DNA mismatch repair protein MutS
MAEKKLSPMMQAYMKKKADYEDCLLFYRLGDFYEMFFDDAKTASKVLGLTLTGRECGLDERAPMCGIPYHAASQYIARLTTAGFKVAVCEQLSEPIPGKIVERDVVKIISAGTTFDENQLASNENNFLMSIAYKSEQGAAISYADAATGEFKALIITDNATREINNFILKIKPTEIFGDDDAIKLNSKLLAVKLNQAPKIESLAGYNKFLENSISTETTQIAFESLIKGTIKEPAKIATEKKLIEEFFETHDFKNKELISSIAMMLFYLKRTVRTTLSNLSKPEILSSVDYLSLDGNTKRNLEIVEGQNGGKKNSLLSVLDLTSTPMGARLLKQYVLFPLINKNEIEARLDSIEELKNNSVRLKNLSATLENIKDIERICGKLSSNNFMPKDALNLAATLKVLPEVAELLKNISSKVLKNAIKNIANFADVINLIENAILEDSPANLNNGGFIKPTFNNELFELKNISTNGKEIIAKMEAFERDRLNIKTLKIGFNNIFGYYIEVKDKEKHLVPYNYERKQTIAGGERYITDELKQLQTKILNADENSKKLEIEIFNQIKQKLSEFINQFKSTSNAIAIVDVFASLALVATKNNYVRPTLNEENILSIVDGRHPVVEKMLDDSTFTANDTNFDSVTKTMLITGPNMAGKSTYMRQVALITLMAHIGSFVPATSANICLTDKIFTRIGASDDLAGGSSTFMVEMNEVATILENATKNSLIILDEVGRGTATFDGLSIAYAVMEYITNNIGAKTLFATHYHELTKENFKFSKNFSIKVKEVAGEIIFLHKIEEGASGKSFGIEVARLAGLPVELLASAKDYLGKIEN